MRPSNWSRLLATALAGDAPIVWSAVWSLVFCTYSLLYSTCGACKFYAEQTMGAGEHSFSNYRNGVAALGPVLRGLLLACMQSGFWLQGGSSVSAYNVI